MPDKNPVGRPKSSDEETRRKQLSLAAKIRRARLKAEGYKTVNIFLPQSYKECLDQFCNAGRMTRTDFFCAMFDFINENPALFPELFPEESREKERQEQRDR